MNVGPIAGGLFLVAVLAAVASLLSDGALAFAVPMGALAVVAAGAGGAILLARRVELRRGAYEVPEGSPVVALAGSFRSGAFGRRAILATLAGLERHLPDASARGLDEEARLLALRDPEFERWVRGRIDRLETET
ncbi:MAG TPA: hypothetical protein VFF67_00035 [Thermoplasmata archaeon]|nr:hypothetical protein [Thermoplasmata archaeon]